MTSDLCNSGKTLIVDEQIMSHYSYSGVAVMNIVDDEEILVNRLLGTILMNHYIMISS